MIVIQSLGRVVVCLLWAGAFALAAAGLGARLQRLMYLEPKSAPLRWAMALGLGLGVLVYLTLGVGLLGLLHAPLPLFIVLACLLIGWNLTVEGLRFGMGMIAGLWRAVRGGSWAQRFLLSVVLIIAGLGLVGALGPPVGADSLTVHLALPKTYLRAGRIIHFPSNFNSTYPAATDMLFLLGMWAHSAQVAQLFNWMFSFVTALAIYGLMHQLLPRETALLAVALFYAITDVAYQSYVALVDIGVAAWQVLAFAAFYLWFRNPSGWQWAALAGLFVGFAGGSKYTGIVVAPILGLFILLVTLRQWRMMTGWRRWVPIIGFAVAVLAGVVPWYARIWLLTGNPVYPYFHSLFPGSASVAAVEFSEHITASLLTMDVGQPGILRILGTPWTITIFAPRSGKIGPMFLACAPLVLLWLLRGRRHHLVIWILAFSLLFEPVWASSYLRVRTGLALFALLAVPISLVILNPPFGHHWVRRLSKGLLLGLTALWLIVAVGAVARQGLGALKPVLGLESERDYLIRVLPAESGFYSYEDFEYINQYTPQDSRIFIRDFVSYYLDRDYVLQGGVFWGLLPPDVYGDPTQLRTALDNMGVTHFVIRNGWLAEPEHNKERFRELASVLEAMPGIRLLRESEHNKIYGLE